MTDFESEWRVFILEDRMRLYRAIRDPDKLEEDFKSNYERGRARNPADLRATVIHMAVSFFDNPDTVRRLAPRFRLGQYVATLDFEPRFGVCVADTGGRGHWSVWARPLQLREFVTEVQGI